MSVFTNPTETSAVMGTLFLLYLALDKMVIPLLRDHLGKERNGAKHTHGDTEYICLARNFEPRITTLEAQLIDTRQDVIENTRRQGITADTLAKLAIDIRVIRERLDWIFRNRSKRGE